MTVEETPTEAIERHASWAELFFDLVVVAGVAALAHVLHDDVSWRSLGLYVVLFSAFWLSWTSFMLYGNSAGGRTRVIRLLIGMFGLAVMAAAAPGVADDVLHGGAEPEHLVMVNAFAVAYVATRLFSAGSWRRGQVVLDWPVAQQSVGALPWLASLWVDEPWKFWLWALGIALDVVVIAIYSPKDALDQVRRRAEGLQERHPDRGAFPFGGVVLDPAHLGERLGLFVIIVLGEGVIQSVGAATESDWDRALLVIAVGAFVVLAGMWALSVLYGHAGVPHLRPDVLPLRGSLALHATTTAAIAAVAASLGGLVAVGPEPVEAPVRWLFAGSVALYFLLGVLASLAGRNVQPTRILLWSCTGIAVPLLLAGFGSDLSATALVWAVAAICLSHLGYEWQVRAPEPTSPPAQ